MKKNYKTDSEDVIGDGSALDSRNKVIVCVICRIKFTWTKGEQKFYLINRLSQPKRCKECRGTKKEITEYIDIIENNTIIVLDRNNWAVMLEQVANDRKVKEAKCVKPPLAPTLRLNMTYGNVVKTVIVKRNMEELQNTGRVKLKIKKKGEIVMKTGTGTLVSEGILKEAVDGITVVFSIQ